ncbi:MAG: OsmC family protein [Acidobacteriaceae bacterium]
MQIQTFKVATTHPGQGTRVEITARGHRIIADEPTELGGTDTGANPVEVLLGALGACQSIVAQVHAKKFGVSYEELRIELEGDIDLDGFFDVSNVRAGYSEIRYKYFIKTAESEEKLRPFLDFVARKCPVGDTIENAVHLVSAGFEIEKPVSAAVIG